MKVNSSKKIKYFINAVAFVSVTFFLALIVFKSLNSAINISTFHLDGAFQTASGLFRFNSGQVPGRDFFPYLGVGPLLLIFPVFKLFGGTLFASAFAAKFVALALGWVSITVLWHLIFRSRTMLYSLAGGAAVLTMAFFLAGRDSFFAPFAFAFEPGNSLRPVRAAAPYLVAIASYLLLNFRKSKKRGDILLGLLLGITLLWSNDFAIPTAGIFGIFYSGFFYFKEKATWKKSVITVLLMAFFTWAFFLVLVTAGHPLEFIKYNFLDVIKDQWWYFGPYGPSTRVFEFSHLLRILSQENYFPIKVLLIASVFAFKKKDIETLLIFWIGLTLFAGGCLASIGGHLGGYFHGFHFWGTATTVLTFLRWIQILITNKYSSNALRLNSIKIGFALVTGTYILLNAGYSWLDYRDNFNAAKTDPDKFYVSEFGGYLGKEWQGYIDYIRQHKDNEVIEEYWGIWSSLNGKFPSWPVDSVIHALGSVRNSAKLKLAAADTLISTRYGFIPDWQPWNLSQNFWFYEELLSKWEPDYISPTTIVWRKIGKPREQKIIGCQVSGKKNSFSLESEAEGFYAVTLNYTVTGSGRYLLMLKNNISYAADADGYVSLPPGNSSASIPVLIKHESGNIFDTKIVGNNNIRIDIESCTAKEIAFTNDDVLHIR